MRQLIQLWIITLIIAILTIALLVYGYIYNDSVIYFTGDLIGIPFFSVSYLLYRKEYDGYVSNARSFK